MDADEPCTGEPAVSTTATVCIALPTESSVFLAEWIVRRVPVEAVDFYAGSQ